MTSTTPTISVASAPSMSAPLDLRSLDVSETLVAAADARRSADRAEADLLAMVVHLVDLHPVDAATSVASWQPAGLVGPGGPVAGAGTPPVAERAVEELGAVLDVSYRSALGLVTDALELCFRLPRLWGLVQTGRLQSWKARTIAAHTRDLSLEAAAFVDRHAAVLGVRNRVPVNVRALVHEALAQCDPDTAQGREEAALAHREVVFDYTHTDSVATAELHATLDTLDALDLDATISDLATQMRRLGDHTDLGVRRAHALGLLADPQRVLIFFGDRPTDTVTATATTTSDVSPTGSTTAEVTTPVGNASGDQSSTATGPAGPACPGFSSTAATLYLHLDATDLATEGDGSDDAGPLGGAARVEKLGATTLGLLRDWLTRVDRVTIRPVLDLNRTDAVDQHDPPPWMRDLVILRDGHCVFPGCRIDARACDLDHIRPYQDPDTGGPPGQTTPANLACLCRRHHRLKTFTGWTYHRTGETYTWSTPHGLSYTSHPTPQH